MRVSSGSVFLAAVATSSSLTTLVGAAPADSSAPAAMSSSGNPSSPAAPGIPSIPGIPGAPGLSSVFPGHGLAVRDGLEARQPGLLASISPIVMTVLQALGLLPKESSSTASAQSSDSGLTPDQITKIGEVVKNMTGGFKIPVPLPVGNGTLPAGGIPTGVLPAPPLPLPTGGLSGLPTDAVTGTLSSVVGNTLNARGQPEWAHRPKDSGVASLVTRSKPDWAKNGNEHDHAHISDVLQRDLDARELPSPASCLPGAGSLPVPSLPLGAPSLPVGAPSPPVGAANMLSPRMPPNPPNTPASA